MFDDSEQNLAREAASAIEFRRRHTDVSAKLIKRYAGRNYRTDWSGSCVYKPHEFEYVVNFLPQLAYDNPAVEAKSDLPGIGDEAADAVQNGLNGEIPQIGFSQTAREVAQDVLFDFGVILTTLERVPGFEQSPSPPLRPVPNRISPRMFFMDSRALSPNTARHKGHMFIRDRETMKAEVDEDGAPLYDGEVLDSIGATSGEEIQKELLRPEQDSMSATERDDVTCIEMWVPEMHAVYTLACTSTKDVSGAKLIRKRPYFGPPAGPYRLMGIYSVPDQLYPLSPLAVSADKAAEFNAHAEKASRDSAAAKRLLMVDANNTSLSEKVIISPDGAVIRVPGFTNQFAQVDFGGAQPKTMEYLAYLREDLDRQSGLTDVQRGNISGDATATEVAEASAATSIRTRAAQTVFREGIAGALSDMGWYMWSSEHVQMVIPVEQDGQRLAKLFVGGQMPGVPYESLHITIQPYSMEMVSQVEQQRNATDLVTIMIGAVPVMAQFPTFPWDKLFDDWGESRNRKGLGERYATPFMQQALMQQQIQTQMEAMALANGEEPGGQAKPQPGKPRLAGAA